MRNDRTELNRFENLIDDLVLSSIERGITKFDRMLLALPGVYPSAVLEALKRLVSSARIAEKVFTEAIELASTRRAEKIQTKYTGASKKTNISLPVPHPLDYEWRFATGAIKYLLEKSLELTQRTDTIVLLGSPSVFQKAIEWRYPRQLILCDLNEAATDYLLKDAHDDLVIKCDLTRDELPQLSAKVVICDPPWYLEYVKSFLWSACKLCSVKGYLLLSTPPIGTRPGVDKEWAETIDWVAKLGLALVELEEGVLPYLSPPFERNALGAEGLYNIPREWRCSNLARFIHAQRAEVPRPIPPSKNDIWTEEVLRGVRIRFRQRNEVLVFDDPSLITLIPGDILPSVSRWDQRRKLADVWTSGNRIFACKAPELLQKIVQTVAAGRLPENALANHLGRQLSQVESKMVIEASRQVIAVVESELSEYVVDEEG